MFNIWISYLTLIKATIKQIWEITYSTELKILTQGTGVHITTDFQTQLYFNLFLIENSWKKLIDGWINLRKNMRQTQRQGWDSWNKFNSLFCPLSTRVLAMTFIIQYKLCTSLYDYHRVNSIFLYTESGYLLFLKNESGWCHLSRLDSKLENLAYKNKRNGRRDKRDINQLIGGDELMTNLVYLSASRPVFPV